MAQRDYATRSNSSRKKKTSNGISKTTLLAIAGVIVVAFAGGLYILKEKAAPEIEKQQITKPIELKPKSVLPSRPEEVWSYIQDLETREIPVDNNPSTIDKNAQLTAEQKKILAMLAQDKIAQQKRAEESKKVAVKMPEPVNSSKNPTIEVVEAKIEPKKTAPPPAKIEKQKQEITKKPEIVKQEPAKVSTAQTVSSKKFGLQCGAFKNKEQAENLQARLAMAGFNSRVASSADWNRVFIGPIGDRAAASNAQSRAKSVTNCVIITM